MNNPEEAPTQGQSCWVSRTKEWQIISEQSVKTERNVLNSAAQFTMNSTAFKPTLVHSDEFWNLQATTVTSETQQPLPGSLETLPRRAAAVSLTFWKDNSSHIPLPTYSCMYYIQKKNYNLNSDPFKSILIIWFTHRISIEQNFDVENLCQNFSVRKSSSFFYRAQHSCGGHIKRCENNPKFHCPFLHFCIMSFSSLKGGKHLL